MIAILLIGIVALAAVALWIAPRIPRRKGPQAAEPLGSPRSRRILFPFLGGSLSRAALDAALRLARSEDAVLVPTFLAQVPMHLPLDASMPAQCTAQAMPLQEAIEQRAAAFGVSVDARIVRGRTPRHGLRQAIAEERFDRLVIAAGTSGMPGFGTDDIAWLLEHAPGEIIVLRPGPDSGVMPTPAPARRRRRLVVDPKRQNRHHHAPARL